MRQIDQRETLRHRAWNRSEMPQRVLIIRLHATGDVAITLPTCVGLGSRLPHSQIDYLTTETNVEFLSSLGIFNSVLSFPCCTTTWQRCRAIAQTIPIVRKADYDLIIDLQRNWVSRSLRCAVQPDSYVEFERFSLKPAAERVLEAIRKTGISEIDPRYQIPANFEYMQRARQILCENGWNGHTPLVVLNPAGLWLTRNWPVANYISLAKFWLEREEQQFIVLGTDRLEQSAKTISSALGKHAINLVNKTSLAEAFAILQQARLVISEDSGLMHLSWISGIPTIALFGSTNHTWASPIGSHTRSLHSGDLECGACDSPVCKRDDVFCLTRYTPEHIFQVAQQLLHHQHSTLKAL